MCVLYYIPIFWVFCFCTILTRNWLEFGVLASFKEDWKEYIIMFLLAPFLLVIALIDKQQG